MLGLRTAWYHRVLLLGCLLTVATGVALVEVSFQALLAAFALESSVGPVAEVRDSDGILARLYRDSPDTGAIVPVLSFAAFVSCVLTIGVAGGALGFAGVLRRRELALLRLIGATRGRVRRLLLSEGLVLAPAAVVLGGVAGWLLTPTVVRIISRTELAPAPLDPGRHVTPVLIAAAVGVVLTLGAAWSASRAAGRVRPVEALREADLDRRVMTPARWLTAAVALAAAGVMLGLALGVGGEGATPLAIFGSLALSVAATALAPVYLPIIVRLIGLGLGGLGEGTRLAVRGAVTARRRTSSMAVPVIAMIGFVGVVACVLQSTSASVLADQRARTNAQIVVEPTGGGSLDPRTLADLADTPGVQAVWAPGEIDVATGYGAVPLREPLVVGDLPAFAEAYDAPLRAGSLDIGPRQVVIAQNLRDWYGLGPGDRFDIGFFGGPTIRVEVTGVVDTGEGDSVVLASPDLVPPEYRGDAAPGRAELVVSPGRQDEVMRALEGRDDLTASTTAGVISAAQAEQGRVNLLALALLAVPGLLFTCVAIVSIGWMNLSRRRPEVMMLRLLGASRSVVRTSFAVEAGAVALAGLAVAVTVVAIGTLVYVGGIGRDYRDVAIGVPWVELAALALACLVVAVVTNVAAAEHALRTASLGDVADRA